MNLVVVTQERERQRQEKKNETTPCRRQTPSPFRSTFPIVQKYLKWGQWRTPVHHVDSYVLYRSTKNSTQQRARTCSARHVTTNGGGGGERPFKNCFPWNCQALGAIDMEEEDKWTLEELGIDFPAEWASNEFLEGRNW